MSPLEGPMIRGRSMAPPADHPFDSDTQANVVGENRFAVELSDRWNALGRTPNGGYLVAVCLAALEQVLAQPDPVAVSAFFLRPARPGPAEVVTDVARSGRRVAVGEARLVQEGEEIVRAVATFADLDAGAGPKLLLSEPPDLPPPEAALDLSAGAALPGVTIADQIDYRVPELPGWVLGQPTGSPRLEFWMRLKGGREADPRSLAMLVDAAAPVVLELGEAGSTTMQLTVHVRATPAPGWLACRAATRHIAGGMHEEDFEIWDSTGALVAQSRQLALLAARDSA